MSLDLPRLRQFYPQQTFLEETLKYILPWQSV